MPRLPGLLGKVIALENARLLSGGANTLPLLGAVGVTVSARQRETLGPQGVFFSVGLNGRAGKSLT